MTEKAAGPVFPAYAGVFPEDEDMTPAEEGLPRIRGGVSVGDIDAEIRDLSSPHMRGRPVADVKS